MDILQRLQCQIYGEISLVGLKVCRVSLQVDHLPFYQLILFSCDSYNTAQLQLLSGSGPEEPASQTSEGAEPEIINPISRPNSRGRSRHQNSTRQPTISEPPSALIFTRDLLESSSWPDLRFRDAHSAATNQLSSTPPSPPPSGSDPDDSMGTDDEEEIEFWGGESPRPRQFSPIHGREMALDDSSEDDEDDEDESDDVSDNDDLDEDEYDRMEFIGHR